MKVAMIHSRYMHQGGEEAVFDAESLLLSENGHTVSRYEVSNEVLRSMTKSQQARVTVWNQQQYDELVSFLTNEAPDIAHFHNTFPLISPAGYYAAHRAGVPVVQTLHNYRLICANGLLYRDQHVCEDCIGKQFPYPALKNRCYRDSVSATATVVAMQVRHRLKKTFQKRVHAYIALTEFTKRKFIAGGLPEDRLHVKPNFLSPDPGVGEGAGGNALFVGRLSYEKGIQCLIEAWKQVPGALPLHIVGDGPEAKMVKEAARQPNIHWLGKLGKEQVLAEMQNAAVLIFPSVCYENMPLVIPEAFACGLPVLATDLPSLDSLIESGKTGLRFKCGDAYDLAKMAMFCTINSQDINKLRVAARDTYEAHYTPERNLKQLLTIYNQAKEVQATQK